MHHIHKQYALRKVWVFSIIFFAACQERTKDKETTLVVSKIVNTKEPPKPPPTPYSYYGCFNFIFDTDGTLYYYQRSYDRNKAPIRVIDFDSDAPIFINLNPDDIIIIPEDGVKSFIARNILKSGKTCRSVRVIGVTDTIKSRSIDALMNIFADTANHIFYSVRKTTVEESVVLDYKRREKFYYSDKVNWDSSKIWFDRKRME